MQRILVAVDGSPHSLKGVTQAAELAKMMGASLQLVYVLPPILLSPSIYGEAIKKVEEGNRLQAEDVLRAATTVAAQAGVTAQTMTANGAPAEALADLAQDSQVWGIVIGAYSSIYVAAPLQLILGVKREGGMATAPAKAKTRAAARA